MFGRMTLFICLFFLAGLSSAQLVNRKPGSWDISVQYPRFLSKGPVAAAANAESKRLERQTFEDFLADARVGVPELRKMGSGTGYYLLVVPTRTVDTPEVVSGYVVHELFTGGANVNTFFEAMTWARVNGKIRPVTLQDLFLPGVDAREECSKAILAHFFARGGDSPSSIFSGSWTSLSPEQMKSFALAPDGLIFLFGKYEIASGAEGRFTIKIPYSELLGLNRNGVLKSVIKSPNATSNPSMLYGHRWVLDVIQYNDDTSFKPSSPDNCWIEVTEGEVRGRAGINRFSGKLTVERGNRLKWGEVVITKAANPEGSAEAEFERRLFQTQSFLFTDNKLVLELPIDSGVLIFRRS
ncbi:MAG TPA: RsiV family protein [Fimbriimonadaceae bacterium]|nr:RsiV family protein [Fimbriimonadaceae bacterium]HRJ34007.1 RsiV family protein [Fimbriimonadaceae bacterium]